MMKHVAGLFFAVSVCSALSAQEVPFPRVNPVVKVGSERAIPKLSKAALAIEAESGDFFGVKEAAELKGFSGSGYVLFPGYDASSVALDITMAQSGWYVARLSAVVVPGKDSLAQVSIDIDDNSLNAQRLPVKGIFTDILFNTPIYLEKGDHRIVVNSLRGEWALDRVSFEPLTVDLYSATLPRANLVTKEPLPAAEKVFQYLLSMQGKGILSGQQIYTGTPEISAINGLTGKAPAVLGIDLIDLSPTRVEHGAKSFATLEAKKYWKAGGLVTCCWHWNAPANLVDQEPDKQWFTGFRPESTTFDFRDALDNPQGGDYRLLLRDIDVIAGALKELQDAGVPVLWRPLHEASGGWFWWGTKGPDAYIRLYKLMYDRLVNYHKLRNLIWVWNGQSPEWYPGDEYVDIISMDIYPDKQQYLDDMDKYLFAAACSAEPKLVTISENGTLPDVDAIAQKKVPWSWFCTWDGVFTIDKRRKYSGEYTDAEMLKKFYANPWVITRDELPKFN